MKTEREKQLEDALSMVLPMAKGYAYEHPFGGNQGKCVHAERVLAYEDAGGGDDCMGHVADSQRRVNKISAGTPPQQRKALRAVNRIPVYARHRMIPSIDHACQEIRRALSEPAVPQHPDDDAVDRFADAMKAKLKWEREERGRGGWDDPEQCSDSYLATLLVDHLRKGNPGTFEDVANFAMMLHQRGAIPTTLAEAAHAEPAVPEAVRQLLIDIRDGGERGWFYRDRIDRALAQHGERETTLDDVKAWADGILGAQGTEYGGRVTDDEARVAHAIDLSQSGEGLAPEDTARLDKLERLGDPGVPWIARPSCLGRGYRLHQSKDHAEAKPTVREAIDAAPEPDSENGNGYPA